MTTLTFTVAILLLILTIDYGSSRSMKDKSSSDLLLSDGLDQTSKFSVLELDVPEPTLTTSVTCEPAYGFLPCTTKLWGQLFMLVVYEYLLSLSEQFISNGSHLFFQLFGKGIFGATLFHLLVMFPKLILVLASGISASEESIQNMATISMGLLAGSAIMMVTIIWGSVIAYGSYDLSTTCLSDSSKPDNVDASVSANEKKNKPLPLTGAYKTEHSGYGMIIDTDIKESAIIMLVSMLPFLVLQLASVACATRVVVLISLIISFVLLVSNFILQEYYSMIQNRRLEFCTPEYIKDKLLERLSPNGRPDEKIIKRMFRTIDKNDDSCVSPTELKGFLRELQINEFGLNEEDATALIMKQFDTSGDQHLKEGEFVEGISCWLTEKNKELSNQQNRKLFDISATKALDEKQKLLPKTDQYVTWWGYIKAACKAAFFVTVGIIVSTMISNPLMTTIVEFSASVNIPSFLISYVVVPLALSFKVALKALTSLNPKSKRAVSIAISELYHAVFMNNVIGLVIFLGLVYIRDISWVSSAEVLVVLLICTAMGLFATFSTKIERWTCILAFLLYPISLLLIYVFTNVLG